MSARAQLSEDIIGGGGQDSALANSSSSDRVNIPKRGGNAPKARSAAVKAPPEKRFTLGGGDTFGLNCARVHSSRIKPGSPSVGGSANTPRGKANRLERGDTFAETEEDLLYLH